jgi:hypothetical protein
MGRLEGSSPATRGLPRRALARALTSLLHASVRLGACVRWLRPRASWTDATGRSVGQVVRQDERAPFLAALHPRREERLPPGRARGPGELSASRHDPSTAPPGPHRPGRPGARPLLRGGRAGPVPRGRAGLSLPGWTTPRARRRSRGDRAAPDRYLVLPLRAAARPAAARPALLKAFPADAAEIIRRIGRQAATELIDATICGAIGSAVGACARSPSWRRRDGSNRDDLRVHPLPRRQEDRG